jgi:hypothetical protein
MRQATHEPPIHSTDADCAGHIDPETDTCRICRVDHGDPCQDCGGRGYHADDCPELRHGEAAVAEELARAESLPAAPLDLCGHFACAGLTTCIEEIDGGAA